MRQTILLLAMIVSTVLAQSKLERACNFRNLVNVANPVHENMGYGVWEVPGGKMPALWTLNPYLTGRLEMLEEGGMPYVRISEHNGKQGEASLMLGNGAIKHAPGLSYHISGKIRGTGGSVGAYIYLKKGGWIVRRLTIIKNVKEWIDFHTILDTDVKDVSYITLCVVSNRNSTIEVGNMKIEEDPFKELTGKSFVISNDCIKMTLRGSGSVTELIDKRNGNDIIAFKTQMFVAKSAAKGELRPDYVSFDGEYIHVSFDNESRFMDLFLKVYPKYFTLSLIRENLGDVSEVKFFNLCLNLTERHGNLMNIAHKGDFCAFLFSCNDDTNAETGPQSISGDYYVNTASQPSSRGLVYQASAYREFKLLGAKIAFAALPSAEAADCAENIEIEQGLPHLTRDGIWLRKHPGRTASYMMAGRVTEENVDEVIDFAKGGFGCIEMTDGWYDSSPTYEPHKSHYPEGMKNLKAVADKIHAAGLLFGLHSMQGMVGWGGRLGMRDKHISPVADSRLLQKKFTTLAKDIDEKATTIVVEGPLTDWPEKDGDLFINGEIVRYKSRTDKELRECERGFRSTYRHSYKAGQRIGLIVNCWPIWGGCIYAPDIESTLFDEIIERQAYVINETKADMLYFDAGEEWQPQPPKWRNTGRFINALQKRLHTPVFAGGNNLYTANSWHSIVRGSPAYDPMYYGRDIYTMKFKGYRPVQHSYNMFTGDVGWYRAHVWSPSTNAATPDELELLCLKAAATSSPISVQIDYGNYYTNKRMNEMLRYIKLCDKIKQEGLLPQNVCAELYNPKKRHALLPNGDSWDIVEQTYSDASVLHTYGGLTAPHGQDFKNPYAEQIPILRLRALPPVARPSAKGNMLIADFNKGVLFKPFGDGIKVSAAAEKAPDGTPAIELSCSNSAATPTNFRKFGYEFEKPISIADKRALCVWVKGEGKGGILNVQLTSTERRGSVRENYIDLNFTGWRQFILDRPEDERFFDFQWPYGASSPLYRPYPYTEVIGVNLFLNKMPAKTESHVLVGGIEALAEYDCSIANPVISVNGKDTMLPVMLEAHDYVEWHADGTINLFERDGGLILTRKGPQPPKFAAGVNHIALRAKSNGDGDARCELTCIFRGEKIFSFKYKTPAEPEPKDYRMLRGDRGKPRTMLGNMELMPLIPASFVSCAAGAYEKDFGFARIAANESLPAAMVISHIVGQGGVNVKDNVGKVIMDFADAGAFAEGTANIYGKFVSGSGLVKDASGVHANGAHASIDKAPRGRSLDGKGVIFRGLNSSGGNWASKGITFADCIDISEFDRILLNINGDGGGESIRIQFWDEKGKYADWVPRIDFTGWRRLCFPLSMAIPGFNPKRVKCFIVMFNNLPMYNESSVVLADLRGLRKGENFSNDVGKPSGKAYLKVIGVDVNGVKFALPAEIGHNEYALVRPDGKCGLYDNTGKLLKSFDVKAKLRIKGKGNHVKVEGVGSELSSMQVKIYAGKEN